MFLPAKICFCKLSYNSKLSLPYYDLIFIIEINALAATLKELNCIAIILINVFMISANINKIVTNSSLLNQVNHVF